jgi:Uma2 family endonuclease
MNWQQVLDDKSLQDLPYRIELNAWGQIVMSPVWVAHSSFQGRIEELLRQALQAGRVFPECAIATRDNVKVADVVWVSSERFQKIKDDLAASVAPEICVEVQSASNTMAEMMFKKELYLERGAVEFWLCDEAGNMSFYNKDGTLPKSLLVPGFPARVEI